MIQWRKSSYSGVGGSTGDCVEVADLGATVSLRDSKNPTGPNLALSDDAFRILLQSIKKTGRDLA
ncbi:DUF397 domain-containing protein [Actinomadura hibisca]|uniref:DUF397 domain-containing protein n=1 Tax=Actinomadura hibisca TaxID=68565 RepID=UPI000A004696|nr:DUF397 domain-containing protein [Actinomadura hibisca]